MMLARLREKEESAPARPARAHEPTRQAAFLRSATLGYALLALAIVSGLFVVVFQQEAGIAGIALLAALTLTGAGLIYAASQPKPSGTATRARLKNLVLDQLPDAVAVTNKAGAIVYANEAYVRAFSGDAGALPGPDVVLGGVTETAARLFRLMRAAAEGENLNLPMTPGPAVRGEPEGTRYSVTVAPLRGARGLALWRIAIDGRETNGAERGVVVPIKSQNETPLAGFIEGAPIGIALVDAGGNIVSVNRTLAAWADEEARILAGRPLVQLVGEGDREALLARFNAQGRAGEPLDVKSARGRTGQVYLAPAADSRTVLYLIDTTEHKQLELQFAQAQKMQAVGELAGGIAHDFNNNLQGVLGFTELLLHRHKPGDPSFADLMQIKNNASRAARLVGQILAFSRQQVLQPKVFGVSDLLSELSDMLRRILTEKIKLVTQIAPDAWPVKVDEIQFHNMIMNLAVNAKDAMEDGGTVTVRVRNLGIEEARRVARAHPVFKPGDYTAIEVSDTGSGMPKEVLARVFEPFFSTKGTGKGTGLGLSMVYGFVKQSGGYIFAESQPGAGTTFSIYLPRYEGAEERTRVMGEEAERGPARDLTGRGTILLVEDEDAVRTFAARALSMRGYSVLEASGGAAALEIVRGHEGPIGLIVTDVVMPQMDGPALVKEAKAIRPDLRVIYISGYAEDAFRRADENREAVHFLPKPFSLKQLAAKVKDVIEAA